MPRCGRAAAGTPLRDTARPVARRIRASTNAGEPVPGWLPATLLPGEYAPVWLTGNPTDGWQAVSCLCTAGGERRAAWRGRRAPAPAKTTPAITTSRSNQCHGRKRRLSGRLPGKPRRCWVRPDCRWCSPAAPRRRPAAKKPCAPRPARRRITKSSSVTRKCPTSLWRRSTFTIRNTPAKAACSWRNGAVGPAVAAAARAAGAA